MCLLREVASRRRKHTWQCTLPGSGRDRWEDSELEIWTWEDLRTRVEAEVEEVEEVAEGWSGPLQTQGSIAATAVAEARSSDL